MDSTLQDNDFLSDLRTHLRTAPHPLRQVVFDPGRRDPKPGEILIGVGSPRPDELPAFAQGICLNNKNIRGRTGKPVGSVSEFVAELNDASIAAMAAALGGRTNPVDVLQYAVLVVEDISPDSCFGFLAFLARLAGKTADDLPRDWLDYATRWERGDVLTTGRTFESWGVLHSALGHSFLNPAEIERFVEQRPATESDAGFWSNPLQDEMNRRLTEGWRLCLLYLTELLIAGAAPAHLPRDLPFPEHRRALACLRQEEQQYRQALAFATRVQLLLPLRGQSDRDLLVDGFIATEPTPLGSLKSFLRWETEQAELKQGFPLMALHRPAAAGTGNDMVVSVEPSTGVTFKGLWEELERLENERWQGQRPHDKPRHNIIGYSDEQGQPTPGAPNQPWYDTFTGYDPNALRDESYTLIAAPKRLDADTLGTRLNWQDVVDALWRLYNPARKLRVRTESGPCTLHECAGEYIAAGDEANGTKKRLVVAHWVEPDAPIEFPLMSSTLRRILAAHAARPSEVNHIGIRDLPDESEFDVVKLGGGLAVIHYQGVFLFDDWHHEDLLVRELRYQFEAALKRVGALRDAREQLDKVMKEAAAMVQRRRRRDVVSLVEQLTELRAVLHQTLQQTGSLPERRDLREFRQKLEDRWGIAGELAEAVKAAKDLEDNLRAYDQARMSFFANKIATFGFPLLLLLGWINFTRELITRVWSTAGPKSWSTAEFAFGTFFYAVAIMLAAAIIIRLRTRRRNRAR